MILLKNATHINWETLEFTPANVLVEEGTKGKIFINPDLNEPSFAEKEIQTLDCSGKYVTKSFAIGHHHVYSALARGMGAPAKNPENFNEILQYIWWALDKSLDKEMIEASALATAMACAKAGSTFAIDHHASPNAITGSLEIIAKAFEKVGVSHLLCYEITDRDGEEKAQKGLDETENYLKTYQGLVGLHASFTVGDKTMKQAADLAGKYNSGAHIHVAEDLFDQEHCQENYGKRVVNRLNDFGLLESSKAILGHCLHLDEKEEALIRNSQAWVVENIESNLNNNVGYFKGARLGDRIFMGTDGMHSDMLRSAQAAFFVGQRFDSIDFSSVYQRFRNTHHYLAQNNFDGDGENNLVVLDYDSPTDFNADNFLGHFVFGLNSNHVQHVISDGKLIVKDKNIQTVNEAEVLDFTREQSLRLWEKMKK
jgi:cytosine/adenosine deaminase-related metal-dependent hydrolase